MAEARGVVTVSDILDGRPTVLITQTNENHTFTASGTGVVDNAVRDAFENDIRVFVGNTQAEAVATITGDNQYTVVVQNTNPSSNGFTPSITRPEVNGIDVGRLTVTAIPNATNFTTFTLRVTVRVLNTTLTYDIVTTLSKALGGSASVTNITPSRLTFAFDNPQADAPSDGQTNIILEANNELGGATTWRRSVNGAAYTTITGSANEEPFGADNFSLRIEPSDFGNNQFITYEASRSSAIDRVTIYRQNNGNPQIYVLPVVTSGSLIFRNNTTPTSTVIEGRIYQENTQIDSYTGWTYSWTATGSITGTISTGTPNGATLGNFTHNSTTATNGQLTLTPTAVPDGGAVTINITATNPNF